MNEQYETLQVALQDMMPLFREQLAAGKKVRFTPHGNSMWPMLRSGRDMVELSALPQQLRKHDLVLYQRANGHYVLHRIVHMDQGSITCSGDRQLRCESGLQPSQMIALVKAFRRNGRWYAVTHPGYWLYCRLWPLCKLIWRGWKRLQRILRRKKQNGDGHT
ncbi:MAG: S24/S26 family peptidase [Clostridia bacterium]|nr:S24/S26 family peptidase [Clostridia bacterium]